jgi:hypothetical protein
MLMEFLTVGTELNCNRPLHAAELLDVAKLEIERLFTEQGMRDGKQPFIVKAIVVDLRHGLVDIVMDDNK